MAQLLEGSVLDDSNRTSVSRALEENLHAKTLNPTSCKVEVLDLGINNIQDALNPKPGQGLEG